LQNKSEKFSNKSEVILTLNKKSHFSIHQAVSKFDEENIAEAADLFEKHLENFPSDPTAQILLGRTYARLGKYHQAAQLIKSAAEKIHSPGTFEFYQKEIEMTLSREKSSMPKEDLPVTELVNSYKLEEIQNSQADGISSGEPELVSETLAKIYVSQGEFNEAIKIYQKLIERKPESREKYSSLVKELKTRLE
jgi:tetratricopeptide (TPR) repeat protein